MINYAKYIKSIYWLLLFSMNTILKFRTLHLLNHIILLFGIHQIFQTNTYLWFIVGVIFFIWFGIVGVNVSLHRYYAHKSFKTTKFKEKILLWSSVFTGLGSPAMWCSVHRMHHAHSDTNKDPHNPRINGIIKTWFAIWPNMIIPKRFFVPFIRDDSMRWVHNNYFLINFTTLLILCLIDIRLAAMVCNIFIHHVCKISLCPTFHSRGKAVLLRACKPWMLTGLMACNKFFAVGQ